MIGGPDVLFPTDFSPRANHAFNYAIAFAKRRGGKMHIGHVLDSHIFTTSSGFGVWSMESDMLKLEKAMKEHAEVRLNHLVERAEEAGVQASAHIVKGRPVQEVTKMASEHHCGLVVMATHGRAGLDHFVFGSVAERVIRESPVPVLAVKRPEHEFVARIDLRIDLRRVLFPTDFSSYSERALPMAVKLCREFGSTLVLVYVNDLPVIMPEYLPELSTTPVQHLETYDREGLDRLASTIQDVPVETRLLAGRPHKEICKAVDEENIDLVVMPTHGRTGITHLMLGSVAEKVVRYAHCPVMSVRPDTMPKRSETA